MGHTMHVGIEHPVMMLTRYRTTTVEGEVYTPDTRARATLRSGERRVFAKDDLWSERYIRFLSVNF